MDTINGLVICRSKHNEEDEHGNPKENPSVVGCSFMATGTDDRNLNMELGLAPQVAADLEVDKIYQVTISEGGNVEIGCHIDHNSQENLTLKGEVSGQAYMRVRPHEKGLFEEGKKYSIKFSKI